MQKNPHWDKELDHESVGEIKRCSQKVNPSEFNAKQVPCQPDSYSQQEPSIRTLARFKEDDMPYEIDSPSSHLKIRRLESNLCLCGESWPNSLKFCSLMVITKVFSLCLRSTSVHSFSASKIAVTTWFKTSVQICSAWNGQKFNFTAPDLCVPYIANDVLRQVVLQASTANVRWPPIRLQATSPLRCSPFRSVLHLALSLTCCLTCSILLEGRFSSGM